MSAKEKIKKVLEQALRELSYDAPDVSAEIPKETSHGDYATNVAFAIAKYAKKNPMEVAQKIRAKIPKNNLFEKVEVVPPGFINFYLSKEFFIDNLTQVLKDKNFGKTKNVKNQKVIIEYTDPNILKEFHIGHLMSNAIGESLSRIIEFNGAKVKRFCYQSDVGIGIAKTVWGKLKNPDQNWQSAYVFGNEEYEQNENAKQEIIEINKKIFERSDKKINAIYDQGKKESIKSFEAIYKRLGTKFDDVIFESEVANAGKKNVESGLKKGIFEKGLPARAGQNAPIIFKGEKFGLHTRVFINSEGLPTYEAKELALAQLKYDTYKYDKSIIITGNEVNAYFKVLLCAMGQLFPDLAEKTYHIGHGMMRLPEGKMSSRTGRIVTGESLIEQVKKLVLAKVEDRELAEDVSDKVAIGAIKYSILKQSIGSDIIYDFDKSISFEGDSGPYLQYSYARARSVLKKAMQEKVKLLVTHVPNEMSAFEKMMHRFPEVVEEAGKKYEPHYIALYLTELSQAFNNYYVKHKIVDASDGCSPYRVALTKAFSIIMKNGLWLLGVSAPEKM